MRSPTKKIGHLLYLAPVIKKEGSESMQSGNLPRISVSLYLNISRLSLRYPSQGYPQHPEP